VLIVFAWFLLPADYRERMTGMTTTQVVEEDPSTKRRIGYYFIGWEVFKERPLIGMGPKTFASIYGRPKYADYALLEKTSFGGRNEHSSYLHVLVGLGSLGLIIIFWFYLSVVRDVIKAEKYLEALGEKWSETWQIAVGFEILYYSYMFLAFFMDMLFDKHFWFWMAMGVVAYKITRDKFVQSINSRVVVEPGRSL
jgi:O-antigen ligase